MNLRYCLNKLDLIFCNHYDYFREIWNIKKKRKVDSFQCLSFTKNDNEEGDLNRSKMTAKLIYTLETAMHRAMQEE